MSVQHSSIPLYQPSSGIEEKRAVEKALDSGYWNEGKYVREFERKFAEFVGAKHCILVPNGALALWLALSNFPMRKQKPEGGRYLYIPRQFAVPDYYGIFAAYASWMHNRIPWILDVDRATGNMRSFEDERNFEPIVVHNNGRIGATSIMEDCAQAITHHRKGCISCYSFHSTKMMTCAGIGGAVCCDDQLWYEDMSAHKDHGRVERALGKPVTDEHSQFGTNLKMSDLNAAFGIAQLERLQDRLSQFKRIYQVYRDLLGDKVGWLEGAPQWRIDCLVKHPQEIIDQLAKHGIEAKRFYRPTHQQKLFNYEDKSYPNTNYLYERGIYLPSSPNLTDGQVHDVCERLKACL